MNQHKRGKGRGGTGGGFNRGRSRAPINVVNTTSHPFNQNDESRSHIGDIYKNPLMIHSITKLLGCQVTVQTCNGIIFDGILKTLSPKGDVTLEVAHKVAKRNKIDNKIEDVKVPSRNDLIDTLVLGLKHIVYVSALNIDLDEVRKDTFTDSAISSRLNGQLGGERQLQKWEDTSMVPDESLILDDSNMKNGLDPNEMFAANEQFGIKSTYEPKMLSYTTPVENCSKELEIKAERMAREIEEGSSFRERAEYDSGKTEEELFSSVVRNSAPVERSQPPKPKPQHVPPSREENKREVLADSPGSSSPKPQRVQLRERDVKLPDGVSKPISVIPVEQARVTKEAPATTPPEQDSPVKPLKVAPKVVDEAQSGISILSVSKPSVKEKIELSKEVDDLKQFHENFKLGTRPMEQEEQKKKDTVAESVPVKDQPPVNPANEPEQQKESIKTTEQKRTDTPPKTEEKSTFKWNINAKEFKPANPVQSFSTKTPPLQSPQPVFAPSPTSIQRVQGFNPAMMRHSNNMKPRQAYITGPRPGTYFRAEAVEGAGAPPISAATAAGSPIIAPGHFHQFIAVQSSQQFPPGMVQHMQPPQGYTIGIHPGAQGGQQPYMAPQTVGIPTSQGVGQGYQDSNMPVYGPSNIQMAPNPSYPGSPQPSPTATGQFHLQYIPQIISQQPGNQPHIPQAVMAAPPGQPPQPLFVVQQPQQGGQQHVGMHGIPVSGPGNPMMNQFVPGHQQQHYPGN